MPAEVYAQIDADITDALTRLPATGIVLKSGVEAPTLFKVRLNKFSVLALKVIEPVELFMDCLVPKSSPYPNWLDR